MRCTCGEASAPGAVFWIVRLPVFALAKSASFLFDVPQTVFIRANEGSFIQFFPPPLRHVLLVMYFFFFCESARGVEIQRRRSGPKTL